MEPKEKKAFEPSGLVPRSIVRTFERFRQQLLPGSETAAIREYRISRYQVLVSARCLFTLLIIPIATNWLVSSWLLSPLVEHFWNTQQNEIFLNSYQEERAFAELESFSEKLFFESLLNSTNTINVDFTPYADPSGLMELRRKEGFPEQRAQISSFASPHTLINFVNNKSVCYPNPQPAFNSLGFAQSFHPSSFAYPSSQAPSCFARYTKKEGACEDGYAKLEGVKQSLSYASPFRVRGEMKVQSLLASLQSKASGYNDMQTKMRVVTPQPATNSLNYVDKKGKPFLSFAPTESQAEELSLQTFAYPDGFGKQSLSSASPFRIRGKMNVGFASEGKQRKSIEQQSVGAEKRKSGSLGVKSTSLLNTDDNYTNYYAKTISNFQFVQPYPFLLLTPLESVSSQLCKASPFRTVSEAKRGLPCITDWVSNNNSIDFLCSPSDAKPTFSLLRKPFQGLPTGWEYTKEVCKDTSNSLDFVDNSLKIKEKVQNKILELAIYYNQQTIISITNIVGDVVSLVTLGCLFIWMKPEITILKSFLIEAIYSLSDTTKSFLLILLTDLLVGFHSPRGWETALELLLKHFGLPENQDFVFLFVATFPVLLDTVFKYWIFRHLNKISPSTVATYHSMIE